MRTNIEIDDKLMKQALKASKLEVKTKKAVVDEALKLLVQVRAQEGLRKWFGKVQFDDAYDYKAMRGKNKWAEAEKRSTAESTETKSASRPTKRKAA